MLAATRYTYGSTLTDFGFTGQRSEMDSLGLYYYKARWYDPALGRFAQADTIVPNPGNPQAWDRYAYTYNNPIRYNDPSGHGACDGPIKAPECDEIADENGKVPYPGPTPVDPTTLTTPNDNSSYGGQQLYDLYVQMWYDKTGWWWDVFGDDGQFSVWEYLGILWGYEFDDQAGEDTYWGYMESMSRKIRDLGFGGSVAGQLNYLAAWSQSAKMRINQQFRPHWTRPNGGTYTCEGGIPCTLSQSFNRPWFVRNAHPSLGAQFARGISNPAGAGYPEWNSGKDNDLPYEVAVDSEDMDYAVNVSAMVSLGYYWQKNPTGTFLVLTYCQYYYMENGVTLAGCNMTAQAPPGYYP